jgi:lysophospholipase L1-like esterase
MKHRSPIAIAVALLVTSTFALATRAGAAGAGGAHYYLALGDSLARSAQPNGDYQHGYAEQLTAQLQAQDPSLRLVKLGCGGATTTDIVEGSSDPSCKFAHKTQLAEAVAFLQAHRRSVSLVTIDIGANDVTLPGGGGGAAIAANLPLILDRLRAAAGPGVPIVGMSYYDPNIATAWLTTDNAAAVQAEVDLAHPLNLFLEQLYAAAGDPVAAVEGAFQLEDTTPDDTGTPVDVSVACSLTWICVPPPLGPDVHATTAGYGVIAQAFLAALP